MARRLDARDSCTLVDCGGKHYAKGFCRTHYERFVANGDPLVIKSPYKVSQRWLQAQVETRDRTNGCWEWPFYRAKDGYGSAHYEGKATQAHSLALIFDGKPRPQAPNNQALHSCDNPPCVNPDHLRWGSAKDNVHDAFLRGRR